MRLKIYTGKSVKNAMDQIRKDLGDDAVIVNIDRHIKNQPVRVTVALDDVCSDAEPYADNIYDRCMLEYDALELADILQFHNFNADFFGRLNAASIARFNSSMVDALSCGLDSLLQFKPLLPDADNSVMLIGQPGQGKTLAAVKLAAMAKLARRNARIITMDGQAAGALAQLQAFCTPLDVDVIAAQSFSHLLKIVESPYDGFTVVDTAGLNPYVLEEMKTIAKFSAQTQIELIWVFSANSDSGDIRDSAEIFLSLGVRRFIATRCDTTRRYTALINVLSQSGIALAALSASPFVGDLLTPGTAYALAESMVHKSSVQFSARPKFKVAS